MSAMEDQLEEVAALNASSLDFRNKSNASRMRFVAAAVVVIITIPLLVVYHPFKFQKPEDTTNSGQQSFNEVPISSYCDRVKTRSLPTELSKDLVDGNINFPATTQVPLAKSFFNQGLTLFYGFNNEEAVRYFRKAAELDPSMAMAHFGQALAVGSNLNVPIDAACELFAKEQIDLAVAKRAEHHLEVERDLIEAHAVRYSLAKQAGVKYRDAMAGVYERHPDNPDVAAIYIDSIVDLFPFAFWHPNGSSTNPAQTTILEQVLDSALARDPRHIGLNHFNIHVREGSDHPEKALPSAQLFDTMQTSLGHILHMPAHVYMRLGEHQKAADANVRAIAADAANTQRCYASLDDHECNPIYAAYYNTHNLEFLVTAYTLQGQTAAALKVAAQIDVSAAFYAKNGQPRMLRYAASSILTMERLRRWGLVEKQLKPGTDNPVSPMLHLLYRYARAKALLSQGDMEQAKKEHKLFLQWHADITPHVSGLWGVVNGHNVSALAALELEGTFAFVEEKYGEAVAAFRSAVAIQDAVPYDEPVAWMPMRPKLGAALFSHKKLEEAQRVFEEDLRGFHNDTEVLDPRTNKNNLYSAFGLWHTLVALKRPHEEAMERFRGLWNSTEGVLAVVVVVVIVL